MRRIEILFLFILILTQTVFSQSIQEMQKLKSEYEQMKNQPQPITPNLQNQFGQTQNNENPNQINIVPYTSTLIQDSAKVYTKFFGYDFFTKRDTVGFWENLSIPKNYILGPGDEIIISLWGETSLRQSYTISRSGKIYDEKVGVLNISGKTTNQAQDYILKQFGRIYSTLNGQKPSTFLDISLGALKSINVNFVGEVNFPGVYAIHPFSNVISGLIQAGGIDTTGSLRSIQIKRNNEKINTIDLYEYLLKGNLSNRIQLKDEDIVLVEIRKSTIAIDSLVYRPGIYESIKGETIKQLIDYAGGLKPNASHIINIKRIAPINERGPLLLNNEHFYSDYNKSHEFFAQDGDIVTINKMLENIQQVEMIGQVKRPGVYSYYNDMSLYDLIEIGGGFNDSTFWKSIYHSQSEIVRREPSSRYEKVIKIDLSRINDDEYFKGIKLQNLDRFVVHSNLYFFEKKNIQINGEVNIPGSYPLIIDNETLQNMIDRAGGLTNKALDNGIAIFRDKDYFNTKKQTESFNIDLVENDEKVRVAWQSENITLMPGDSIIIKEKTGTINILGAVYNPGLIEYKKGKSIKRYINDAGGISERGNKNGIIVVYANGVVVPMRWYSSPKILDGSTIIVNQKEEVEAFDITQFATNWTQIVSSLITAVVLSQQVSSN